MAMTAGLLAEPTPGHLAHSRISAQFIVSPDLLSWATFMTHCSSPTAACFTDATARWSDAVEKTQTAYNIANDTEMPFFAHVAQSKEMTSSFAGYMRALKECEGTALEHVLEGFDWGSLGNAHVVDVSLRNSLRDYN